MTLHFTRRALHVLHAFFARERTRVAVAPGLVGAGVDIMKLTTNGWQ